MRQQGVFSKLSHFVYINQAVLFFVVHKDFDILSLKYYIYFLLAK